MEHHAIERLPRPGVKKASAWTRLCQKLPPEGEVVMTKLHDENGARNFRKLVRKGRLWFHTDGRSYVYYTPTHWMPPASTPAEPELRVLVTE